MTQDPRKVLVVSEDTAYEDDVGQFLEEQNDGFAVQKAESFLQAIDMVYSDPPDLVIVNQSSHEEGWKDFCTRIKVDNVLRHLPIVIVLDPDGLSSDIDWEDLPVDDYLPKPMVANDVKSRVSLIFARAARVRDANPLSHLPGNYSIMRQIQGCIDRQSHFEVAYLDLDNFKSYNDKYGFLRGDEIIKMTARLLTNAVRKLDYPGGFVGHVGGDDFVMIVLPDKMDGVCQEIIKNFDLIVGDFYDEDDRIGGGIASTNRKGEKENFPLMSISIAVVTNEHRAVKHIGEVSAIAAEIKKHVKSMPGSNYHKDLRGSKS